MDLGRFLLERVIVIFIVLLVHGGHTALGSRGQNVELLLEIGYLLFKLLDHDLHLLGRLLHIRNSFVLDQLYSLGKFERLNALFRVRFKSADGANETSLGIATETFFEQVGQFGISEWDVLATFRQGLNNTPKRRETLINLLGFL